MIYKATTYTSNIFDKQYTLHSCMCFFVEMFPMVPTPLSSQMTPQNRADKEFKYIQNVISAVEAKTCRQGFNSAALRSRK